MKQQDNVIDLHGSPHDIGYQHGRVCKEGIRAALSQFLNYMNAGNNISRGTLLDLSAGYLPYAEEYAPDLVEEIQGIADGADLTFEEIFLWNCLSSDFLELQDPNVNSNLSFGCTSLAVCGDTKSKGKTFIAQSFDWLAAVQPSMIFLKINPKDGLKQFVFSVAGRLGFGGLNNSGVALCINKLFATENRVGVPSQFIYRKALQQPTIGDALGTILYAKRATGVNYLLVDENGEIIGAETTAKKHEIIYGFSRRIGHSNHYTAESLKQFERLPFPVVDSIVRLNHVNRLLVELPENVSFENIAEIFKDHTNYPNAICRHGDQRVPEALRIKTLASIIIDPGRRHVWFTVGNPCENPHHKATI